MELVTSESLYDNFGLVLADYMADTNRSTAEVGRMAGVSASMVSHWTTGRNTPSPEQVFAIEKGLGLDPGELSKHLGYQPNEAVENARLGIVPKQSITILLRNDPDLKLNPEIQEEVVTFYRRMVKLANRLHR